MNAGPVNLIIDVRDERFDRVATHHTIEALGTYSGVSASRYTRVPEDVLAWLDLHFGGWLSSDAAAGSAWIARDAAGVQGLAGYDARGSRYRWLADREADTGIFGPFAFMKRAHPDLKAALLHGAMYALMERGYRRAIVGRVSDPNEVEFYRREAGAQIVRTLEPDQRRFRAVVLASGTGSNFGAVAEAAAAGALPLDLRALVVNRRGAGAIALAEERGVPLRLTVWDRASESREAFDRRVIDAVAAEEPDLVLLLGWMHVLPAAFVERFPDSLNLHPGYLPLDPTADEVTFPDGSRSAAFRGAHAVDDALAAGSRWIGATVHHLGLEVDRGRVLVRAPLAAPGGDRAALIARLHALERTVVTGSIARWAAERP